MEAMRLILAVISAGFSRMEKRCGPSSVYKMEHLFLPDMPSMLYASAFPAIISAWS